MRVSRAMRDTAYKVLQAKEAYMAEHQREPTVDEIARMLELKREDVVFALDAIVDPVSLYEPVYSDSGDTICVMDQVRDSKNTDENWLEQIALREAIAKLSDREKRILSLRFFQGKTQMEVSTEVGISQAQVSRLEKNALRQIKRTCEQPPQGGFYIFVDSAQGYVQDHHEQEPGHYPPEFRPGRSGPPGGRPGSAPPRPHTAWRRLQRRAARASAAGGCLPSER